MIEVTADSNIYISALHFDGVPLQFLDGARRGVFRLSVSGPLLDEVRRVLRDKFFWQPPRLEEAIVALGEFTTRVDPVVALNAVPDDPDDNRVLECAVAAGSHYIVTGDNDLLRLGRYNNILIIKVADFLTLLAAVPDAAADEKPELQA